jgi:hypothetical protein
MAKKRNTTTSAVPTIDTVMLAAIVAATLDLSKGFVYTAEAVFKPLVEAGLVEINMEIKNEAGEVATRASQKGIEMSKETPTAPVAAVEPASKPIFELQSNVAVPVIKRGGRTGDIYPFAKMEIGQSFFIGATEAKPNPAKSLASTVASATARYAQKDGDKTRTTKKGKVVPVMVETRKFIVRSVEEGGVKGARVWRTK